MENLVKFECDVESTNYQSNLHLEIVIDNNKIFDSKQIREPQHIEYEFSDNDGEHELAFYLSNKTDNDTMLDENGNIIQDSLINIKNIKFDSIDLGHLFTQLSVYLHDQNGHSDWIYDKFYGMMGCNGKVTLKFTTPIYLWLLENM